MFQRHKIINAIEIGSSKIVVWSAEESEDGRLNLLGRSQAPAAGTVAKGEIRDMSKAAKILERVMNEAHQDSGKELTDAALNVVLVTGCGIASQIGIGTAFIKNDEHIVTEDEVQEAIANARIGNFSADRELINSTVIGYTVDGRRVSNPLNQKGRILEVRVNIISVIRSRLDNFRSLVRNCGIEEKPLYPVYSPLASGFGILAESERDEGVLLVDLGAGCTDYLLNYDGGSYVAGTLQIGLEHLANDLAIGLDLHIDVCRRLLEQGTLEQARQENKVALEFRSAPGKMRQIPLESFEQIIEVRLREIFEIVRQDIARPDIPINLATMGVLTGGGAYLPLAREIFSETFHLPIRIGKVADACGAVTGIDDPRYSAIWGALKVGNYYAENFLSDDRSGGGLIEHLAEAWRHAVSSSKRLKEVIKF